MILTTREARALVHFSPEAKPRFFLFFPVHTPPGIVPPSNHLVLVCLLPYHSLSLLLHLVFVRPTDHHHFVPHSPFSHLVSHLPLSLSSHPLAASLVLSPFITTLVSLSHLSFSLSFFFRLFLSWLFAFFFPPLQELPVGEISCSDISLSSATPPRKLADRIRARSVAPSGASPVPGVAPPDATLGHTHHSRHTCLSFHPSHHRSLWNPSSSPTDIYP